MKLVFDIEADNLLDKVTKVHCIVAEDIDTGAFYTFDNEHIEDGLELLQNASVICGHNILGYDIPVLEKLFEFTYKGEAWDTLVASRLKYSRLKRHSLRNWGEILEKRKLVVAGKGECTDFSTYSPDMLEYCIQDVVVNTAMLKHALKDFNFNEDYVQLEQSIVTLQVKSEAYGVTFDLEQATKLSAEIYDKMQAEQEKVESILGYSYSEKRYALRKDGTPPLHAERFIEKLAFTTGVEPIHDIHEGYISITVPTKVTLDTKKLLLEFLVDKGWESTWKTEKGSPQMTRKGEVEPNLMKLDLGGVNLGLYFVLKHRYSILQGFLKNVREDGKIPSEANTLGAITGRYTHRKIANLPAVRSPYGMEIRSLFTVDDGRVQVGSDLSGIEARLLAHYMGDSDFTKVVLEGDIHTVNQIAAGLPTRDSAKTFFYGFIYGAGDGKVGELVGGGAKEGKAIKEQYLKSLPALATLIKEKQTEAKSLGGVISLDARLVLVTKSKGWGGKVGFDSRKALNTLLQSSGTIYFKKWLITVDKLTGERGLDAKLMISYHDEGQWSVSEKDVEPFKQLLEDAIKESDDYFNIRCENAIETKTGKTWGDCH